MPRTIVEEILRAARAAPSGANLQPGRFYVTAGAALDGLAGALADAISGKRPTVSEYSYFPRPMPKHLKAMQVASGQALYAALGIDRRDTQARRKQFAKNYRFFGAPVGIVVTIDRAMGMGCFMDLGMALMALQIAANECGLGTCGIGALANYADVVQEHLEIPGDEMVVCGMALGWPDLDAPGHNFRTDRLKLESYSTFLGFED